MRIKENEGRVVYSPLSDVFQMTPMGGSLLQKYDATSGSYMPNRKATPLVLCPSLILSDPDGVIPTADYVSQMVNVSWILTVTTGGTTSSLPASVPGETFYTVDSVRKNLTLYFNVAPNQVVHVKFTGQFVDNRRGEVLDYAWEGNLGCEAQTDMNVTLDTGRWRGAAKLSPMKHWGQFGIPVQLMNGKDPIPDEKCTYTWQWWNEDRKRWLADFSECPWLVGGENTKEIVVDQDFIQKVILRVRAVAFDNPNTLQIFTTKLRRWYGQFDYDVEFLRGKYVFHDTKTIVLNAWVANGKGIISRPQRFFDMELFFATGNGEYESVGYGEEAIIHREGLQSGRPRIGILCRELSAFRPLALDDGTLLCTDDDIPIFAQFPTKTREV